MKTPVSDANGLITSEPVLNKNGAQLLPKGVVLNEPLIAALLKQHIEFINVEIPEAEHTSTLSTEHQREQRQYIDLLFEKHQGPVMTEFKQCLLKTIQTK